MAPLSHRWRWHKSANWTRIPQFWTLPQAARGALYIIEELTNDGPIAGDRSRVCRIIGIDPRHQKTALDPLIEAGFVAFTDQGRGVGEYQIALEYRMSTDAQDDGKSTARTPQEYRKTTARLPQDTISGERESSNDACLRDRALLETRLDKTRLEETPQTPQGAECATPKKKREKPEDDPQWDRFWSVTGKRVDKANALKVWSKLSEADRSAAIEGMTRQCEQHRQRPDFAENGWQFFRGPATWLRARAWEDEPAEATKAQHEPPAAPRSQTGALMEWFGAHRAWKQFRDEASAIEATRLAHAAIAEDATADWLPAPHHAAAVVPQFLAQYAAECSSAN